MTPTALVTGASGFLGGHVAAALLGRGYAVRCLVRRTSLLDRLPVDEVELHYGDVVDASSLPPALEGVTHVFHIAGVTRAPDRATYLRVNAGGTRNLVRAARERSPGLLRFVLVSSLAAGGTSEPGRPRRESDPDRPQGDYGASKREAEEVLREESGSLPWTILRPTAIYGPGDRDFLLLARLAARGTLFQVGREEQRLTVLHVGDLAEGMLASAVSEATRGGTYYLAHPEVLTWTELGRMMAGALGKAPRIVVVPRRWVPAVGRLANLAARLTRRPPPLPPDRLRDLLAPAWTCDPARAREAFGFRPRWNAEEGVPETVRWYVKEGWL